MNRCSAIIVTHHSTQMVFAAVEAALRQQGLGELIIVDNGNAPDVIARLQQRALAEPRLQVITGHGNVGFAKGCNIAARQAAGEYLLLLKPDYLLPPDAIIGLIDVLEREPGARLVSGLVQEPDGSEQPGSRHLHAFTPGREFLKIIGLGGRKKTLAAPQQTHEVAAVSSACMCVRAGDFKKLGGLDEVFFDQVQGIDFCARVQAIGGRVMCAPAVKITRLPQADDMPVRARAWRRAKGLIRYFYKHYAEHQPAFVLYALNALIMARCMAALVFSRKPGSVYSVSAKRLMILAMGLADLPPGEELKGKIVLVTGATSQVGLSVIRRLIASGAAVLAISRGDEIPYRHEQLRWIKGDLTDHALHLQGYCADMVVHCAPLWHLPPVVELLAEAEVKRVIAFSSTSVFAKLLSNNAFEKALVEKLQSAESIVAERCMARGLPYTIFRPTLIYGAGLDVGITTLAKLIARFGKIYVYPPAFGRRQPVHVDDLAAAVLQSVDNPATYNKSYNLSGGEVLTFRDMLEHLFTLMGKKTRIRDNTMLPFMLDMAGAILRKPHINGEIARRMNDDLVFFHDDAKHDFAFHPRAFLSGGMKDIEGF